MSLQCRHNGRDGVSNHPHHECLLNRLFKAQIKENIKAPRHYPLWGEFTGDRWIPPHIGTVKRKIFPFDDVIMYNHSDDHVCIYGAGTWEVECRCVPCHIPQTENVKTHQCIVSPKKTIFEEWKSKNRVENHDMNRPQISGKILQKKTAIELNPTVTHFHTTNNFWL